MLTYLIKCELVKIIQCIHFSSGHGVNYLHSLTVNSCLAETQVYNHYTTLYTIKSGQRARGCNSVKS